MNDLSINCSELSHNVLGNMGKRTLSVAEQTADESVRGSPVFATLKTNEAHYDSVILKKTYSGMRPDIIAADQDCDRKDSTFRRLAMGFSAFAEPEGAAAQKIVDIYAETVSVYGTHYAEETEILDKRHQLLGAPDAQAAIQSLHIQSVYDVNII